MSTCASGNFSNTRCRAVRLLEGLTRQRTLRNPLASSVSTTFEPRNPLAPVTSTRSLWLIIISAEPLRQEFLNIDIDRRHEFAGVIRVFDQIQDCEVSPGQRQER